MLRVSVTCLVLSLVALMFVPLVVAKALAGAFAFLFVVFLVLGLAGVDKFPTRRRA
jgi:hypothetical protein